MAIWRTWDRNWFWVAHLIQKNYVFNYPNAVLCKSNANDNRRISRFVLAISHRYINKTSHGLANVKTINWWDIGTIFAISRRDIVLARLHCNDISQKWYITTIYCCSEVCCNNTVYVIVNFASTIYSSEVIVYDESVSVYMQWAQSSNKWLNKDQKFAFKKLSVLQRLMGLKTSVLKNVLRLTQWTVHSPENLSSSIHSPWLQQQHITIIVIPYVSKLYFTRLTVKERTRDSKYIIYTYGRKSADSGRKSADRYR